jgi:AAA+ ATPase superfamily predicted ATPase
LKQHKHYIQSITNRNLHQQSFPCLPKRKAEFAVIYGRRRVGKEDANREVLGGKKGVRLPARGESKTLQLNQFSFTLAEFFGDEFLKKAP